MPRSTIERHPDWVDPHHEFVITAGTAGNAYEIIGRVSRALRRAGNSPDVIFAYEDAATAGDYDHLLAVSLLYTGGWE